jgi:hypothetical protein
MSEAEEEFQALVSAVEDASDEDMPNAESKLADFVLHEQELIVRALRRDAVSERLLLFKGNTPYAQGWNDCLTELRQLPE